MSDAKSIIDLIGDIHISSNPNYFYKEVVFFPGQMHNQNLSTFLCLSDIFVDQIDIKLIEEQSEKRCEETSACFFYKN
jgi:hypothetical protein